MPNIFSQLILSIRKPKIVLVIGEGKSLAFQALSLVLKPHFNKDILILESEDKDVKKYENLLKSAPEAVLAICRVGDLPVEENVLFAGGREKVAETLALAKRLPAQINLVLNYDDETAREIDDASNLKTLTFGFNENADFHASDIKINGGTNFKINFDGKSVPIWLDGVFGKDQVYAALAAAAVGNVFDINLVEVSQALRNYHSLPGYMRLIVGMDGSRILDDSASATVFSMAEAIELLGKISNPAPGRRFAVLGDVVGAGKFTIEAHESLGERVARSADVLFTFGARGKLIADGAKNKGMSVDNIFSFDTLESGIEKLRQEIRQGDLVLVDGSSEMKMSEIVEKIRK